MNKTAIILAIVYFAIILIIGYFAGKHTHNMKDFMLGGQNLGVWVVSFGLMAAVMSGWTWLGNTGTCYTYGYSGYVRLLAFGEIGVILSFFVLAKPVRLISERANCLTLPDILAARWNNNRIIRILSSLIMLIGGVSYLVSQWASMGTIMQSVLGISYPVAVVIGTIIITTYVLLGGMLASMWTNFVQMIIMFIVSLFLVFKCVAVVGGFTEMNLAVAAINQSYVQPWWETGSYTMTFVLTYSILVTGIAYGGQPAVNTKFMMIKDKKQLQWSALISVVALIAGTLIFIVGIVGIVLVNNGDIPAPERADMILLTIINNMFSSHTVGLALVAIMAAVMSTASSFLLNTSTTIIKDLFSQLPNVKITIKRQLFLSRCSLIVVTIFTMLLSLDPPEMISAVGSQAFGAFCAGFAPALYLGLRWKRINSKGAIAGMVVGLTVGGILPIIDSVFLHNVLMPGWTIGGVAVVLAYVTTVVVSLMTKSEYSAIFEKNYQPPR